ncbi:hypothetical protein ACA910_003759 [Epithemia clementina (nom. ined.)]
MSRSTPSERVLSWLTRFDKALSSGNVAAATAMFQPEGFWRDLVSFTWNIKTMEGRAQIEQMLHACLSHVQPSHWQLESGQEEACQLDDDSGVVDGWFTFETAVARGKGHIRLVSSGRADDADNADECFTLLTTMVELKGYEETRPLGIQHGAIKDRKSWQECQEAEEAALGYTQQPYCVIVGGGQGGIGLGARLKQLNVPTIIVEKLERPGDTWRKRYKTLTLHDPMHYDHMPYLPFPKTWPLFTPSDKLADWLEMYTKIMDLNYWGSTECLSAQYHEESQEWEVTVNRNGERLVLRPKQLVLATGMAGLPHVPNFKGMEQFQGEHYHSSQFVAADRYIGKKCVVIGSNNSAHDVCATLWEHGAAEVTMTQRSSTLIARSETLLDLALNSLYSEEAIANGIDHNRADLIFASVPYKIMPTFHIPIYKRMKEQDAEFYKRLEDVGFMLDFGDGGSGLFVKYLRQASGFYIDVGASELVANGSIKLKSPVEVDHLTQHGVVLSDGSVLEADLIVYATGFGPMNGWTAKLISPKVAAKVGKVWGLGSNTSSRDPGPWEGEERNMWKPTQQEGLWFHGGNLHQSRHYSQFLALQLKARLEGIATPVYALQEVHHLS